MITHRDKNNNGVQYPLKKTERPRKALRVGNNFLK